MDEEGNIFTEGSYRSGKVLVMNAKTRKIHPEHFGISEEVRAQKVEEIRTVAWVDWYPDISRTCRYSGRTGTVDVTPAKYTVWLIDIRDKRVTGYHEFKDILRPIVKVPGETFNLFSSFDFGVWLEYSTDRERPKSIPYMFVGECGRCRVVEAGSSKTHAFIITAEGGTVKDVTLNKISGPAWIVINPTNLGDIKDGEAKRVSFTISPPADVSGSFNYSIRVGCSEGKPSVKNLSKFIEVNQAPYTPSNPSPLDGAVNQPVNLTLSWTGGDPEGDKVTYEVRLSTISRLHILSTTKTSIDVDLLPGKTYYWGVIVRDDRGAKTEGPTWRFNTATLPSPSPTPTPTSPPPIIPALWKRIK